MSNLNENLKPLSKLNPFGRFCVTIGHLPSSYMESLTYEEQLIWFCNFLEKTVIPAINNNAEATEELQNLFIELKSYVDNYFTNLDVQEEINQKLDEMAEDGTLEEIINQEIFDNLNNSINTNTEDIAEIEENITQYPYFDILKNDGFSDGATPNDEIFSVAKNQGFRKFYFPQNENNNANYYFTNIPNFNDCEILTDENVILNFPNISTINSTYQAKFKNNILLYSREQERNFTVPKNEQDFFNQFSLPNYNMRNTKIRRLNHSELKMFTFNYGQGDFTDYTDTKTDYYQSVGYDIRYKTRSYYSLLCCPLDRTKKECIEIVTTPNTHIAMGWLNSETMNGCYSVYIGSSSGKYYHVNGTQSPQEQDSLSTIANLFSHNGQNSRNNTWGLPIKYKLKNDPENQEIQLYVNDNFVHAIPWCANIDYFGFGIYESSTPNLNSDKGFSEILQYEQDYCPLNASLNILIAGDSRMYGYNSQYHIEDIIKNGLINNGINVVNITNISVSGWSMEQIFNAIQNQDLTQYDIVIVPTGINNINSDYETLLQTAYNIMNYCKNNRCFCIMPATIPVGYGGTDAMANQRTDVYYKIQQAILSAVGYIASSKRLTQIVPNVMGTTILTNNIEVCNDGVHPTTNGTILFAKAIVNCILHLLD